LPEKRDSSGYFCTNAGRLYKLNIKSVFQYSVVKTGENRRKQEKTKEKMENTAVHTVAKKHI